MEISERSPPFATLAWPLPQVARVTLDGADALATATARSDWREGMTAFRERRAPGWAAGTGKP